MGHTIPMSTSIARGSVCPKRQIEGTVISQEDKEPLIGATVIVKGSLSGAETDLDGHFTLEVDPDAKFIIVDYIGMKQTQVPIPKTVS